MPEVVVVVFHSVVSGFLQ